MGAGARAVGVWLLAAITGSARAPPEGVREAKRNSRLCLCSGGETLPDGNPKFDEVDYQLRNTKVLSQLDSHHAILIVPGTAPRKAGGKVAVQALASLPSDEPGATQMTKVVVVGHTLKEGGMDGITIGRDVCDPGLVDKKAANWLREAVPELLGAPTILNPKEAKGCCPEKVNPTVAQQLTYLSKLWFRENEAGEVTRTLKGNLITIMIQKQSAKLAKELGDALALLVQSEDGPWKNERVLFVFASDMSHGLMRKNALVRDKQTVQKIIGAGFGPTNGYFKEMRAKDTPTSSAVPLGFSSVLAALKLAEDMGGYTGQVVTVTNSGEFAPNPSSNALSLVTGYASVAFVKDTRTPGEKISAGPEPNTKAPPTTTRATTTTEMEDISAQDMQDPNYKGGEVRDSEDDIGLLQAKSKHRRGLRRGRAKWL